MTMDELHVLEKNLEVWIDHIRSVKVRAKFHIVVLINLAWYKGLSVSLSMIFNQVPCWAFLILHQTDGYHVSGNPAAEE